jgi:thioredoxin-related protein
MYGSILMVVLILSLVWILLRHSHKIEVISPIEAFVDSRLPVGVDRVLTIYKVEWCPYCQKLKPVVNT